MWLRVSRCLAVLAIGLSAGTGAAADPAPSNTTISTVPGIRTEIHEALQSREFARAVQLIDAELARPKAPTDYLLYLKGRAQIEQGALDEAAATLTALEEKYPDSSWRSRARFARADIFVRSRNYQAAGQIYKAEAERLLSSDRRDELAQIYLEFADRYYEGVPAKDPSQARQPDYQQALNYYLEIPKLGVTPKLRSRVEFRIARCQQKIGNPVEAIATFQRLLSEQARADLKPEVRLAPELIAEARFELGASQLAAGQPLEARRSWQDFLAQPTDDAAVRKFRVLAASQVPQTYGFPQPASVGDLELGLSAVERFLKDYPDESLAPRVELDAVLALMHHARHDEAIARLTKLIANPRYSEVRELPAARQLLGQALRTQLKFDEAIAAWKEFLERYPTDPRWSEVQQSIVDAEFAKADDAREQGMYDEARKLWETFLNKYPLDPRAARILFQFGAMKNAAAVAQLAETAKDSPDQALAEPVRQLLESAISDWRRVVQKYPGSAEASQAQLLIAITLEERLGRLKEALEEYRAVQGPQQGNAQSRIARLTEAQLEVRTERKFHTDERPKVKVAVRNIEKVVLKIYQVDLSDYFRKMHLATGVESLDVALIDPDQTVDHSVTGYEPFRRLEQDVELPVQGPGVWAVTVASDKLEATTMVIVSDLDIIVKSSRNELFVFAEDSRQSKPWEGVSILVSDGGAVFAEESTAKDGVLQKSYEQLKTAGDLRVFAVHNGHVASTVTSLNGLDFAVGLAPRGFLYTDRPAYRAGQLVNIKGIVRWVDGDRLAFKPGEKYTLDVYDSRGRTVLSQPVSLNDFGTVAASLILPATSPQGDYRVHLHQPQAAGGQSYESRFQVLEYRLEPVRLAIDVLQKVVYRGEKITGTIKLDYYYGAPAAGKTIQYRFGNDGPWATAVTDSRGEVPFEQSTQQFAESQTVPVIAQFPERNLSAAVNVSVATKGFEIVVETLRSVFVNGESFEVTTRVQDAAGEAVATPLKLEVFELPRESKEPLKRSERGERLISAQELKSTAEKGEARQTLRLDKGGSYIVRVTGTDRFGNRISGQRSVLISGDEDATRLRILTDRQHFTVGDDAAVTLHWREAPALAVMTYEGAKILGYQLIELKTGANPIQLPLEAKLSPNFTLSVVVMHQHRFHSADVALRVSQKLNITLKPSKDVVKPGDPVVVEIETRDAQGRPVSAELSLSLVQANLLNRFGDVQGAIDTFFGSGERTVAVRQTASCTFTYSPSTQGISRFLLADAERRETLAREAAAIPELAKELSAGLGGVPWGDRAPAASEIRLGVSESLVEMHDNGTFDKRTGGRRLEDEALRGSLFFRYDTKDLNGNLPAGSTSFADVEYLSLISQLDGSAPVSQLGDGLHWSFAAAYVTSSSRQNVTVNGQTVDGRFLALNGLAEGEVRRLVEQEGLRVLPSQSDSETAFWAPAVVTDENGRTVMTITLPERSTGWKLQARGINTESLAGQAEAGLTTKKDLFGELKLPLAFTAGDRANVLVEIHNSLEGKRDLKAVFKTTLGSKSVALSQSIAATGAGISEISFPVDLTSPGMSTEDVLVELTVSSGDVSDRVVRSVPVRPFGIPVYGSAGGTASQSTIAFADFPKDLEASPGTLEILVGPSVNRSLVDAVTGSDPLTLLRCGLPPVSSVERATSDLLGGVAVLKLIGGSRDADAPDAVAVSGRIASAITALVSSQRDDGGWSWTGRADRDADRYLSGRVLWALAEARRAGFAVPNDAFERAVTYLNTLLANTAVTDREMQASILQGLAAAGRADFSLANRLHRDRNALSVGGLLNVALALTVIDRKEMVAELLPLIADKLPVTGAVPAAKQATPWMQNPVELRALYALVLAEVHPTDAEMPKLIESIQAGKVGVRWPVEKVNGPAIKALATWFARTKPSTEAYKLTVFVNDRQVEKLEFAADRDSTRRIAVPVDALIAGKPQRVNFDLEGRGTFTYSVLLAGFVPAEKAKSTTRDWRISRRYEPAERMFDGQVVQRGFSVVNEAYQAIVNPLTQLPLAEVGVVTLLVRRQQGLRGPDDRYPYLVISEPIPAGCQVLSQSVQGDFERFEIGTGEIVFYLGERASGDIRYSILGDLPGDYRAAPTTARDFYDPAQLAVASDVSLKVLARGEKSTDEYRFTPDELFYFGQKKLAKQDFAGAHAAFTELMDRGHRLRDEAYRETVQSLFRTSIAVGRHGEIVRYFEILKEKFPDVEIGFEDILTVASSYRELGEYERSYLVYRATIESGFQREARTSGFLEARGELVRSVQVLEKLLWDYPAEGYIAAATYALAQEVYRHAGEAAADAKLREAGLTRVHLISQAIHMLDHFLSTWPNDPAADQASFSLANALLDLEQYDLAIKRSEQFATRYPNSRQIDSFWYTIGLSEFMLGHPDRSLEMCRKVAEAKFPVAETGGQRESDNKWEAVYIMGQVFHSLGKAADAIAEYTKVKDRFADAAEAIAFFTRKAISIPEVTTIRPAEDKKVELKFRNLAEASVKVYRIDLLKFGLLQRSFDRITAINLAGIRPYHEETLKLGDGQDYRDREHLLTLPLKEEGAYLVVCRGENLYASGLVLVSPLSLEIQEDAVSGRVRVTVKDSGKDAYAPKVHVKVIGSSNNEFVNGDTDLRGLLIADGIRGTSTVIAMAETGRYAFYRGETRLGPDATPDFAIPQPSPEQQPADAPTMNAGDNFQMLRQNMNTLNSGFQEQNRMQYEQLLNNSTEGVKAEKAF